MIGATGQGLVAFDAQGEIEPALAERWIVEDEGKSYIFRLRKATWTDGEEITAEQVARILSSRVNVSARSTLRPDLQSVSEILAMTGRVIVLRLYVTLLNFLRIFAHTQIGSSGKTDDQG